jgi:hypothetical protein
MTTNNHPITPPPGLVDQWYYNLTLDSDLTVATQAARWGADQELEACCLELVDGIGRSHAEFPSCLAEDLRAARRPKPPSLKEQALEALKRQSTRSVPSFVATQDCDTIRRALEQLDD